MKCYIPKAVNIKTAIIPDATPCSLLTTLRHSWQTCCPHLQKRLRTASEIENHTAKWSKKEKLHTLQLTLKIPTVVRHACLTRRANFKFTRWSVLGSGNGQKEYTWNPGLQCKTHERYTCSYKSSKLKPQRIVKKSTNTEVNTKREKVSWEAIADVPILAQLME